MNDHGQNAQVNQLLRMSAAQQEAAAALHQVLATTLERPSLSQRINVSTTALARENDQWVLLIALPTGTRLEVPMADGQIQRLIATFASIEETDGTEPPLAG